MNIVFCADKRVLPGLHVSAYSLLDRISPDVTVTHFHIFSDALDDGDIALLNQTLGSLKKPFSLELRRVDPAQFQDYPSLNGSWATYFRLIAVPMMNVERILYVDSDILCDVDVSLLATLDMMGCPVAWVQEAPLRHAVDREVATQLGDSTHEFYHNAGIMLIDVPEWKRQGITQKAMDYIINNRPLFHDQSALNVVLHGKAMSLDEKYNTISNMRKNWHCFTRSYGQVNRLIHFLDYPKPWDLGAELIHPQYSLWGTVLEKTVMRNFRSWHNTLGRSWPRSEKARKGYKKALKDKMIFTIYSKRWIKNIIGTQNLNNE